MLASLASAFALLTLGLIAMQVVYVFGYLAFMASGTDAESQDDATDPNSERELVDAGPDLQTPKYYPDAAVVLCLKGGEDDLIECLTGLVCQDYTNHKLFIVVDSDKDPALQVVNRFFADRKSKPVVQNLRPPRKTCSLKCSAITQAIESIPSRYEVIAFIDADAVPDQSWLSDLVRPLADAAIGATTGNRWYAPSTNSLGAWVRKIWNAAAVVQMQQYNVPWGGTLAVRRDTIARCGLIQRWRKSFCEDTALMGPLKKEKLKLHRVPNLILENTEDISLKEAAYWISRQLLTVRLHHPKWSWVAAHALVSGVVAIASPILILLMVAIGEFHSSWTLIQAYVAWQLVNSCLLSMIEKSNRHALEGREGFNRFPNEGCASGWMQYVGTLVTQVVYPWTAWQTWNMEKVWWRGVAYKVSAGGIVELIEKTDATADFRRDVNADVGAAVDVAIDASEMRP